MKIALVGAELEENLGLRYMASSLEANKHQTQIISFNSNYDQPKVVQEILNFNPQIIGLSMVFTSRAREFLQLAQSLRDAGFGGHIVAGGHFASFNSEQLLAEYPSINSVALGEGEDLMVSLTKNLNQLSLVAALCYRNTDGTIKCNPSSGNREDLDSLPFPKREHFHEYFGKKISSILSSRGCWRNCAFCSINAWYEQGGGKKFRYRSVENIVAEMKQLCFENGIRIFNFQDDNFFLPNQRQAIERFRLLRDRLKQEKIEGIAIAIKARPESINTESIKILDDLGLFRVFLGVENASANGLKNLNRIQTIEQTLNALTVLNDFDIHVAYNFLMFEPDASMADILLNIRFMERHLDNPFNFCRAEAYAGTGLEAKLKAENRLLGSYFGFDYRLTDPKCEIFHQIANYAFFDRNFSDYGLHYFNMQVDFYFQLLRRFYPNLLSETLRSEVKNFIKQTNLDTYHWLSEIYDFVSEGNHDEAAIANFTQQARAQIDMKSSMLRLQGQAIIDWMEEAYKNLDSPTKTIPKIYAQVNSRHSPYSASAGKTSFQNQALGSQAGVIDLIGLSPDVIPYNFFKKKLVHGEFQGLHRKARSQ
ncbi:MAG TPA: radical SAM protein, partial [Candidatus Binatia bacterium]|nr:radical SAM protein [Candidatus Binatia bacterium]